jgi:hypothetical protein
MTVGCKDHLQADLAKKTTEKEGIELFQNRIFSRTQKQLTAKTYSK